MTRIERFTTPPSFEEVDLSEGECPLDLKDVSKSRKELWLIRAPLGFDGSSLNGVTLNLDGDSVEFSCEGEAGKKYEAMSVRQLKENEGQSPYLLLPSQEERNLEPGPAFKGQVVIMESLSLPPSSSQSQSLPEMKQSEAPKMPEGLRQRFKPFGCETPRQVEGNPSPSQPKKSSSSKMKRKIKEENAQIDEVKDQVTRVTGLETEDGRIVDEEGEPEPESKRKMKKAKRKHIKEEVAEEESRPEHMDDVVDEGGSSPRRKKKKKKSKDK